MPSQSDIEHLLRRTEFVARASRVSELMALPNIGAAVDNVLAVPVNPPSVTLTEPTNWERGEQLTHHWLDRMAHDSPRPVQERMGFFWHGHFCSSLTKSGSAELMQEQVDLFRVGALSNVRNLAIGMSTQVAMLRYLDNNQNRDSSPNQNFARELLELFLLGVGNYTEADVEAATAAWTGHTDQWDTDQYVWRDDWHDATTKTFLGRTINVAKSTLAERKLHGQETIEVVLGPDAKVPNGASVVANRGRLTRLVAAEFLSRKLWIDFAGTNPSATVLAALRDALVGNNFDVTPWLRALLVRPEFYTAEVKAGLVRSPVEFVVECLVATGRRSDAATPLWLMEGMGQRPLFPPNVSGWKHNGYWVNASAMAKRTDAARQFIWRSMTGYWNGDGLVHLAGGTISRAEVESAAANAHITVLDRFLELMGITLGADSLGALRSYMSSISRWERVDVLALILMTPELQLA
jgi:uncharacterized protein (DUF1800 family)